jgi:hypothetical protein
VWQKFEAKGARTAPRLRIGSRGIFWNMALHQCMGNPGQIDVFWDADEEILAISPGDTFAVTPCGAGGSVYIGDILKRVNRAIGIGAEARQVDPGKWGIRL